MSSRTARNIEYREFLTSVKDEHDNVVSPKLEIPEFQRNYVWKVNNIKDLFVSITENNPNYYLGNIVIVKDGVGRSRIVDGQQRLISLSLFAKELMNITTDPAHQNALKKIIWADDDRKVIRILFQKSNLKKIYENILNDVLIKDEDQDETQKILLTSFLCIKDECKKILNLDEFIRKFLTLEFVVIVSPSDDDAYQLFEGLNSTGLSLSAVELTKNSILGKIKILDSTRVEDAVNIWDSIEKNFENINIGWFNKFLRHHWFIKEGYVSNSNLFREIKTKIINKNGVTIDELFDYLEELKKDSLIYIGFRTANLNKTHFNLKMHGEAWQNILILNNFIEKLKLDQIYSVLLALYKFGKNENNYFERGETFQKHMEKIWQFLLIVKYTKISPSSFEKDFSKICKEIQGKSYGDFKKRMDVFFVELSKKIEGLKENFSSNLNSSMDYSVDDKGMVRFILEEYLITKGEGSDSDVEAEHIVPENNLDEWVNVTNKDSLRKFVGRIGNLTLLKNTLNTDAGHKNFNDKFEIAYIKSKFTVNGDLKNSWGDKFNSIDPLEQAIIPRGKEICGVLYDKYLTCLSN